MFDRLLLAFLVKERVQVIPMAQFAYALENNFVEPSSIYFNNTVLNLEQLKNNWMIQLKIAGWLKNIWYQKKIKQLTPLPAHVWLLCERFFLPAQSCRT